MSDSTGIQTLAEEDAIDQIVETVQGADSGTAPFALVLGAGFSHGLVSTARELVESSLPLWIQCGRKKEDFDRLSKAAPADRKNPGDFWREFTRKNANRGLRLPLDPNNGFPEDYAAAYRAAFDPLYRGAVGAPADARRFQRLLMRLDQPRLNAPHFLLASLLGVQPGKARKNDLFKADAAFSRLILTTNFDPFLQTALQSVNRLYFMSDTPELGVSDEIMDDQSDAIHLVYLHGSIHRRSQAATDADIRAIKQKNAQVLAPVLKRHGVIVLGYSGWDDAIVEALAACDHFDHRLYWCGREADPLRKGAYGPRVTGILQKPAASYVQIKGAGHFIAQLCTMLVKGLPRLLGNPIGQVREMLQTIDLSELEPIVAAAAAKSSGLQPLENDSDTGVFAEAQRATVERLGRAEQEFLSAASTSAPHPAAVLASVPAKAAAVPPPAAGVAQQLDRLQSSARVAAALGNHAESVELYSEALKLSPLDAAVRAKLLMGKAINLYSSGKIDEALADWCEVIDLPGAPAEQVAKARVNRGVTWGRAGETAEEIADYTRVIENLPDAPVEQVAQALLNRGVAWGWEGKTGKEIADYSAIIETLPGVPVEPVAKALFNRGLAWGKQGEIEKEIADYTRVIDSLPGAPAEQVGLALVNRGLAWERSGNREKGLADYTRVIDALADAPPDAIAKALLNRGVSWARMGNRAQALADYTRVIDGLPGAPAEQVARSLINRSIVWNEMGNLAQALADYNRVIETLPNAPADQVAIALVNRGAARGHGDLELADYTRVIEALPGAPVEQVAIALVNRGLAHNRHGDADKALADYTHVIDSLPGAPVDQIAIALVNRGWGFYDRQDYPAFLRDTERVLSMVKGEVAAFNLGLALLACDRDGEALDAYRKACAQYPDSAYSLAVPDLVDAQSKWLGAERARPVLELFHS